MRTKSYRQNRLVPFALAFMTLLGCSEDVPAPPPATADLSALGGEREVEPIVPEGFDPTQPTPLVILLHGFGASGAANDLVLGIGGQVEARNFILLRPNGTFDKDKRRFWNATNVCCDFYGAGVDDVAYITSLIEEARNRYTISSVSLIGHSNGAYMSHRFACDRAEWIDAIASIAGSTWEDESLCAPKDTVRVVQIHGSEDESVLYDGVSGGLSYPSAPETVARWAKHNGCDATAKAQVDEDFSLDVQGSETEVFVHENCAPGGHAELWHIRGDGHLPAFNDAWRTRVLDHLLLEP